MRFGDMRERGLSIDCAHFWNAAKDRITWVQNGQRTFRPVNLGATWIQGVEAVLSAALGVGLKVENSTTWTQSINLDTAPAVAGNELPGIPDISNFSKVGWSTFQERLQFAYSIRYTGPNYWDTTNWHRSAARSFHDIVIQAKPTKHPLQVEAGVQNVFNRIVQVIPQNPLRSGDGALVVAPITDFSGYPLPGRVWSASVRWLGRRTNG